MATMGSPNREQPIQSVLTSLTQQDIRQWQEMKDPDWIRYSRY